MNMNEQILRKSIDYNNNNTNFNTQIGNSI